MPGPISGIGARHLVRRHQLDGGGRQDAHAVELAAVEQHLAEAHVVGGGRGQAAAAGEELGGLEVVGAAAEALRARPACRRGCSCRPARTGGLFGRHPERGVLHAERPEDALLQVLVERLAREHLDQVALDVDRDAVVPLGPGLLAQRDLRPACRSCP